jgi:hypothetical protein
MYKSLVLGLMSSSLAAASYGYDTSSAAPYPTTSDCEEEYPTSTVEYPVSYPTKVYESSSEYPVSYPTKSYPVSYPAESYPAESYPATSSEYPITSSEYPYPTGYTTSTIYSETCETYTATGGSVYSTTKTYAVGTTVCPIESYSTEAPYPTNYVTSTYEVTKIYTYAGEETTECYTSTTVYPETEAGSYPTGTAAPTYGGEKPTYSATYSSSPYPTYPAKGGNATSPYVTAGAASFGVSFAAVFAAIAALL